MNHKYLELLLYLAEKTKLFSTLTTSTNDLSRELKTSQQTISRKLREMEKLELIKRKVSYNGHLITLTQKSVDFLKEYSEKLKSLFKTKKTSITGILVDGLGQGSYYLKKYRKKIKNKLNMLVYPGTLNLKVKKEKIQPFLNSLAPLRIKSFKTTERTFGEVICYKIKFKNTQAAIVVPERTRYFDIIEIISEHNLRKKFNLKTGDKITI